MASKNEKIEWLKQHAQYSIDYYGKKRGLVLMRKVAHYYVKDFLNATKIRCMINTMVTLADFSNLIEFIVNNASQQTV
ncbi:hypothetical protein AGMMS49592_2550 [Endomicrobiia bacterium]|nr:hypothetical protein AGMMS49592_2550 [Endomicrobiia bacterium]